MKTKEKKGKKQNVKVGAARSASITFHIRFTIIVPVQKETVTKNSKKHIVKALFIYGIDLRSNF